MKPWRVHRGRETPHFFSRVASRESVFIAFTAATGRRAPSTSRESDDPPRGGPIHNRSREVSFWKSGFGAWVRLVRIQGAYLHTVDHIRDGRICAS